MREEFLKNKEEAGVAAGKSEEKKERGARHFLDRNTTHERHVFVFVSR
jgi:hypothetical protein